MSRRIRGNGARSSRRRIRLVFWMEATLTEGHIRLVLPITVQQAEFGSFAYSEGFPGLLAYCPQGSNVAACVCEAAHDLFRAVSLRGCVDVECNGVWLT